MSSLLPVGWLISPAPSAETLVSLFRKLDILDCSENDLDGRLGNGEVFGNFKRADRVERGRVELSQCGPYSRWGTHGLNMWKRQWYQAFMKLRVPLQGSSGD
jgi:hypothetical protein